MATVFDVAKYILEKLPAGEEMTAWKLQKLVYYSQAWSLVWDDAPLFDEEIEAWANGPVCPELYKQHRGFFKVGAANINGDPARLTDAQKETIDVVYNHYSQHPAQYLSELTHNEIPWQQARGSLNPGVRGNEVISLDVMAEYYGGLYDEKDSKQIRPEASQQ